MQSKNLGCGREVRYSDAVKDAILDKICQGATVASLERELGISHYTIYLWCKEAGLKLQCGRPRKVQPC